MKCFKGQFITVPTDQIFILEDLPAYSQLIFYKLCRHANKKSESFVSITKLAKDLKLSRKTITVYIKKLTDSKIVSKTKKHGRVNIYKINHIPFVQEYAQIFQELGIHEPK